MNEEQITIEEIKIAYRKLKSMSYYDTHGLFLKSRIAHFETQTPEFHLSIEPKYEHVDFEEKLTQLHQALNSPEEHSEYWQNLFNQINFKVLPKKVKSFKSYGTSNPKKKHLIESVFTNVREIEEDDNYEFERLTFFFDAPIEIHLVSILWIMKLGFHLESDLQQKCYGNRLILEKRKANSNEERVTDDLGLFKPYYGQYQKWRDEGISVAKDFLDNKQDVLFINIDVKDYYYSIRLNFDDLDKRLDNYAFEYGGLVSIFREIHFIYTDRLKEVRYPNELINNISENESVLPIGLASSYVLANWYLKDFDERIHQDVKPIYYSRYVDDIFIITANPDPNFDSEDLCENVRFKLDDEDLQAFFDSLSHEEKHIVKTLYPIITLVDTPKELLKIDNGLSKKIFKIQCYKNLFIQPSKTLVYFFKHDSSLALLEKFKNEIEQRSSEFRFLPDEKLAKNGFDDEAYELIFEDSIHKVKTLKDYRENRYGIASHLSKKIYYSLRNGKTDNSEDVKKIITFFKGTNNLEHFTQWERLLTYFVVNENKDEFLQFAINTLEQIYRLPIGHKFKRFNISYNRIVVDLLEHFSIAMEMAIALNPSFYRGLEDRITKILNRFSDNFNASTRRPLDVKGNWKRIRLSNMLRHNYVNIPLLNYTNIPIEFNLLEADFSKIDLDSIDFDDVLISYSPRRVRFCEVAWMECMTRVSNTPKVRPYQNLVETDLLYAEDEGSIPYLDDAFEVYYWMNFPHRLGDGDFKRKLKGEIFDYNLILEQEDGTGELVGHEISISQDVNIDKLRIGLANMKVDQKNYESSMLGNPKVHGRYLQFAKVFNEAESEECDMVVLPELCLPHGLVKLVMEQSWNHQRAIVAGIEHWTHNNFAYNFILTLLPTVIRGVKDTVPILRLKNHYSPSESFWINEYRRIVPKPAPMRYHLLRWKGLYFTNYYCFELADIVHRSIFRSKIDFLIASEWNRDTNLFSNITEVTSRDLHCYFIQVNTSDYGDSRVTHPKKTENKDSLRIKGGLNTGLLVDELDVKSLRKFQYKGYGLQRSDKDFKPTPANYIHDDARIRQENKSFKI